MADDSRRNENNKGQQIGRRPRTTGRKPRLEEFLLRHIRAGTAPFHMPGHKGREIFQKTGHGRLLEHLVEADITEIPGADDLFHPEERGPIGNMMRWYAELYGVEKSYPMVNGASGGLLAAVMATVNRGEEMIVARNAHKAVFNAMALREIRPVYLYPPILKEYGIAGPITKEMVEEAMDAHPNAKAVLLTSPDYYGVLSDIKSIAEAVHSRGKKLIVDQAHGAHLAFFDEIFHTTRSAERGGADLIVNSIHKTLAGLGQTAVLNVQNIEGKEQEVLRLEYMLQTVQTSSPSYILMASMDANGEILENNRAELVEEWEKDILRFHREAATMPEISLLPMVPWLDETKINVGLKDESLSGRELAAILRREYGIIPELYTANRVLCLTGIGTKWHDLGRLLEALRRIARGKYEDEGLSPGESGTLESESGPKKQSGLKNPSGLGTQTLEEAYGRIRESRGLTEEREQIPLGESAGKVAASPLTPYPPGIPLVCPGEVITREDIDLLLRRFENRESVLGVSEQGLVLVCK